MLNICSFYKKHPNYFPERLYCFPSPLMSERCSFPTASPAFGVIINFIQPFLQVCGKFQHFIMILICTSLMTNDIKCLVMCLFAIFILFGETFDHVICLFSNRMVFLLLSFESCLHHLYASPLLAMSFDNISLNLWLFVLCT